MCCNLRIILESHKFYSVIIQYFKPNFGVTFLLKFAYTEFCSRRVRKAINFD
jgi:hypothetical protein